MHDPRVGRFFAVDPLEKNYPWNSPYSFSENSVIAYKELEGGEKLIAIVKEGEDYPSVTNSKGEKLIIKLYMSSLLKHSKDGFNSLSYGIAYEKLGKGYLMGSNGKEYKGIASKLVEEIIDGRKVVYYRAIDKGNQYFSTKKVDQIEAFRGKGYKNLAKLISKGGEHVGDVLSIISFMKTTNETGGIDALAFLDAGIGKALALTTTNPLIAASSIIIGMQRDHLRAGIQELNMGIIDDLDSSIPKGLSATESYLTNKRYFKVLEDYTVIRATPTAAAAYLSGQIKDYQGLLDAISDSPLNEELTNGILVKFTKYDVEIKHIFLDDSNSKETEKN